VTAGQGYYLMVNKWSAGGAGFTLDWTGSTASLDCSVLPVELLSFTGRLSGRNVELTWITASESNNDYFLVERSADGIEFLPIEKVKGAGTTSQTTRYTILDKNPLTGYSYYRLKQVDFDGAYEFSQIIAIRNDPEEVFAIAPVPVSDELTIFYKSENSAISLLEIFDTKGKVYYSNEIWAGEGNNIFNIDVSALKPGVYFIKISDETGESFYSKLIKI
jgi:hypothetical protein